LIGSPAPKDDGGIEIVGLLEPSFRPGSLFDVRSTAYTGVYRAELVKFTGDSGWSNPFYVTATGKPT
jgi:hypothetical protein